MTTLNELLAAADAALEETISLAQALVRVPSINTGVMPTGNETPAAVVLRDKLAADGIPSEILESAPNRGNLVARLSGDDSGLSLLLMGHTDVVPVEDEAQWRYPPFSAEIADGRIWGRGSADMKTTVAAETMALVLLKRHQIPLLGDLILAAGADEEAGGEYGFAWLANNHPDKIRADFAINEGGGNPIRHDGRLSYPINAGEKGRLEIRITVTGRGYHASAPWMADNAIYKTRPILDRIANYEPEVSTDAELFQHLDKALGIADPVTPHTIDQIVDDLMPQNPLIASWLRAASRMTIVASMIKAGVKSNSVAETCLVTCDVRTLPWQDEAYVAHELDKILGGIDGVSYEIITTAVPSASRADPVFLEQVMRATRVAIRRDDLAFFPGLTTGFTDSRLVRPLDVVAYGFAPSHPDSDPSLDGAHNINESASIEDLLTMTRMFVALAWEVVAHRN